jgi:tetratricopeptide (TPR) repeat protein
VTERSLHIQDGLGKQLLPKKLMPAAVLIVAVCAAVAAVHWPALSARALSFDDDEYLTGNVLVQKPSWTSAKRFITEILAPSTVKGYYQPLTMISLMADYALGGRKNNLMPFHRTSLILHIANTALIIVLLYLLFGQIWIAAGVGLLFGVHPMTVEPIPWVGERKTLLAAFFSLWSLIFYFLFTIYYLRTASSKRQAFKFYIGSFIAYLLALMSKPTSTPLPVVMLLMDYWPLRRISRRAILEKVPFFVLGGISAIITVVSQSRTGKTVMPSQSGLMRIPLVLCHNIIFYLYKMIWPVNLSSHYAFPESLTLSEPMMSAIVTGACILITILVLSLRWTRAALTGWLIFFVAILPTMQIIGFTNVIAADKFVYLPSVGLLMALAYFLCRLCAGERRLVRCTIVAAVIFVLAGAESAGTRRYLADWRDTISLYEHMLALTPDAATVHYNMGVELTALGRTDEAIARYRRVIELRPDSVDAHNNLGVTLESAGNLNEAISQYHQVLQIDPNDFEARYNLGGAMEKQGNLKEAVNCYRQALRIRPDSAETYNNLGYVYGKLGRWQKAAETFRQATKVGPDNAGAHYNLGAAYLAAGDSNSALEEYKTLKTLDAEMANKLFNLIHK